MGDSGIKHFYKYRFIRVRRSFLPVPNGGGISGPEGETEGETSLYRLTRQQSIVDMISTATKIRRIRDKLSRIGIGEKKLDDAAILALYSLNGVGNLCPVPRTP